MLAVIETGSEALPAHALALPPADPPEAAAPGPAPETPPAGPAALVAYLAECHYQARQTGQQLATLRAGLAAALW